MHTLSPLLPGRANEPLPAGRKTMGPFHHLGPVPASRPLLHQHGIFDHCLRHSSVSASFASVSKSLLQQHVPTLPRPPQEPHPEAEENRPVVPPGPRHIHHDHPSPSHPNRSKPRQLPRL